MPCYNLFISGRRNCDMETGFMVDKKKLSQLSGNLVTEPENFMHSLRKNLYMYVGEKGITLQEISELADIPISTLKTLIYGDAKDCHISTVIKLAKVFNISVDELMGSGTISKQTCESLQLMRTLPESFTYFVRWIIHFHRDMLLAKPVSEKAVEVMLAECSETGNLRITSNLDIADISDFVPEIRTKIFMGIKLPCSNYEPTYFKGDILFVANDRAPREYEHVIVCISDNMWILKAKREFESPTSKNVITNYYSIRDDRLFATEKDIQTIVGYVVKVRRG